MASSPGVAGVFRTDSSRRVLALSGLVTITGGDGRQRQHLTFVVCSSVLINLALGERPGVMIEWERWKEKVEIIDESSRLSIVRVEGSQVFILEELWFLNGGVGFKVYDFSPGARKDQRSLPYTLQHIALTTTPSARRRPPRPWGVSGDTVLLLEVRL